MNIILIPYLPSAVRVYPLAKYLAKAGNNVHMILWDMPYPVIFGNIWSNMKNSWKYRKYEKEGVAIHKIRRLPFFFPPINKWLFKKQIRRIFNEFNIDVIISESFFSETEPPLDLPILYDISDDHEAFAEIYGSRIYRLAYKILRVQKTVKSQIQKSRAVIAVSDNLIKYAKKYRKNKIYKITNGVEDWVVDEGYLEGKKHSLVYVTNFGKWSKLRGLLFVINELKKEYSDIKLVLIGDGPEIPEAKKTVKELSLGKNVKFLGRINDRRRLFDEINKYEVCLNISEKNKFRDSASPMKVFEYSALGKKIVSTNLKEVKKLNFPNVFFYKEDERNKNLAKAIQKVFETKACSEKTKKMVSQYTWENIIEKIKKIISKEVVR